MESQSVAAVDDPSISERILDAVGRREGSHPLEFDRPLYDAIDPDALDALFRSGTEDVTVEFAYLGYRIVVKGDGEIDVRDRER